MSRPLLFRSRAVLHLVPWSLLTLLGCGGLSDGDVPPADALVLDINGARDTDYVRSTLLVTVQATGATPEKVELLRNGSSLATLIPPFQYTWDTVDLKEGSYRLTARAEWKGRFFESPVHTVVVDRTAPKLVGTLPAGSNVSRSEGRELKAVFSEPMLASSVREGVFNYASRPVTGELSADGKELKAQVYGTYVPSTDSASLNLEGLTDLAGNELVQPGGAKTMQWAWSLPLFLQKPLALASDSSMTVTDGVSLALGEGGAPWAAFSVTSYDAPNERLVVTRWSDSGWALVATLAPVESSTSKATVRNPLLVVGTDGKPMVAFIQGDEGTSQDMLRVARWDGLVWRYVGERLTPPEVTTVHGASLVLDREGRPVVAWTTAEGVHVARWEVDRWAAVGGVQRATAVGDGSLSAEAPALAVDADNRLILAWAESEKSKGADLYVRRWSGSAWEALGGRLESPFYPEMSVQFPSLVVGADNQPRVVWSERPEPFSATETSVFTSTWSGTGWSTSTLARSTFFDNEGRRGTAVALTSGGSPLYAWCNSSPLGAVQVSWFRYGTSPDVDSVGSSGTCRGRMSMVSDANGNPVVAWRSSGTGYVAWPNK